MVRVRLVRVDLLARVVGVVRRPDGAADDDPDVPCCAANVVEERNAAAQLASGYLCRFVEERTPLLGIVDVVVPVPARASR